MTAIYFKQFIISNNFYFIKFGNFFNDLPKLFSSDALSLKRKLSEDFEKLSSPELSTPSSTKIAKCLFIENLQEPLPRESLASTSTPTKSPPNLSQLLLSNPQTTPPLEHLNVKKVSWTELFSVVNCFYYLLFQVGK